MRMDHRLLRPIRTEINRVCPTITPTLGSELVVNGNFSAWTGDDPDGWALTGESGADPEISEVGTGEGHGGTGTGLCNLYTTGTYIQMDQSILSAGKWYSGSALIDHVVSGGIRFAGNLVSSINYTTTGSKAFTERASGNNLVILRHIGTDDITFDNISLKQITFSSAISYLGKRSKRPGTYQCTPTVATNTQTGILLGYADSNNFVMAFVNRAAGQAQLIKRISGTYTSVVAGNITYGAAKALKVIVAANGTDYSLYYDGVQVGITTAINDAGLGTKVYGFNTYSGNTVGTVTTSGATS